MLDRQVALKVMLKSLGEDPQFLERFKREAQAAARLIHPSIAQIYSYDIVDGQPYIAMEMAGGGSLLRLMEVHGKNIDPTRVMRICKQVAEGLSCAADQGLVHGDIKPENILFDAGGAAKVVDFGLAGMQDENSGDEIWGTPYYIAPEKVRKGATDFRVDMYSLGATIYHALVGAAPFEGEDPNEVVKARFMVDAKPPSAVRLGLPAEIDRVILKMMAREVTDRYPSWEACIGDIKKILAAGIVIDESAVAKTDLIGDVSVEEELPESVSTSSTSVKTGGRRLVMKGRRKMVVKKRTVADTVVEPVDTSAQPEADVDEPADLEQGDTSVEQDVVEQDVAEIEEAEQPVAKGKKPMTIGKMIMLGAIGIVVILAVAAGGLVWYIQHAKTVEEQKRMELLSAKTAEAKDAIQATLKSSRDFADQVADLRAKSEKQVKDASESFLVMLDPDVRAVCRPVIIPPETKDYTDAIAYSNKVVEKIAEISAALAKAAAAAQSEASAVADTNAPAATPTPAVTNAPAATPVPAAATAPAATNAPASKPAEVAKTGDKKAVKGKATGKKAKSAPAKAAPASAKVEASAEVKVEEKKVDYPPQLKAFQQLWTDLWTIRAAEIRVNACMALIVFKASRAEEMTVTDVESAEKLAKATSDLVEEFEVMKSQKVIEQALRKAGAIKQKTPDLLAITKQQIERARARAAKLAAEKAAAEAAEAAKKKAAEEYQARAEAEIVKAQEKFDELSARELKRLDWDYAMRQMGVLTNGFEKLTREGTQAVLDQIHKIRCMQMLQQHFIKKGKGFMFTMGRFPRGTKVAATSDEQITLQRPTPRKRSLKDNPVAPKPDRMSWRKFYFEQAGMLNNLIIGLVQDRTAARVGLKEWSNLMFGSALTMSTLFPDEPTVPARVEELVNKAVEEFDSCQKLAERLFPKVFNKEESVTSTSNE
jgi:hypothetical protein